MVKTNTSVKIRGSGIGRALKQQVKEYVGGNYYMLLLVNKKATEKTVVKIRDMWLSGELASEWWGKDVNAESWLKTKMARGLYTTPMAATGTLANSLQPSSQLPNVTIRVNNRVDYHLDRANLGWEIAGFTMTAHPNRRGNKVGKIRGNKEVFTVDEVTTFLSKWVNGNVLFDEQRGINSLFALYYPDAFDEALREYRGKRVTMQFPQQGVMVNKVFKFPAGMGTVNGVEIALKDYLKAELDTKEMMAVYQAAEYRMRQKYSGVEQG